MYIRLGLEYKAEEHFGSDQGCVSQKQIWTQVPLLPILSNNTFGKRTPEQDNNLSVFSVRKISLVILLCQCHDSQPHRLINNIINVGWVGRVFYSAECWVVGAVNNLPLRHTDMCTNPLRFSNNPD